MLSTDHLVLRPNTVLYPFWCTGPKNRQICDYSPVAIRPVQLGSRRSAGWTGDQFLRAGPIRMSTNNDVFHGLDGYNDLHSLLLRIFVSLGIW